MTGCAWFPSILMGTTYPPEQYEASRALHCTKRVTIMSTALLLSATAAVLVASILLWSPQVWQEPVQRLCAWDELTKARLPVIPGFAPLQAICHVRCLVHLGMRVELCFHVCEDSVITCRMHGTGIVVPRMHAKPTQEPVNFQQTRARM